MQRTSAAIEEARAMLAAAGEQAPRTAIRAFELELLLALMGASGDLAQSSQQTFLRLLYGIANQVLAEELIRRWDAGLVPPQVVLRGRSDLRPITAAAFGLRCSFVVTAVDDDSVECRDLDGPVSVTNDAEAVCRFLFERFGARRFFYVDSCGQRDELLHDAGRFTGFAPAPQER